MSDTTTVYTTRVSGLWSSRHRISGEEGLLGTLSVERSALGTVQGGEYRPEKGELLVMRREPGLLRSQFSLWTEGREWLGSSLRWSFVRREIAVSTGSRPIRILALPGFQRGFRLLAPKTGEMARLTATGLGRSMRIEVLRRMDFELVVFSYFLAAPLIWESLPPGPRVAGASGKMVAAT